VGPDFLTASIKNSGMPQRPKPPTQSVLPDLISATAASAEGNTLEDANRTELKDFALKNAVRLMIKRDIIQFD
jgi:hypothetical protein